MRVNADFSRRVIIPVGGASYISSPETGVERLMLDRIGGEVARATSIVRYAPGSSFAQHVHGGGEEFLVLEGVFSDEHGHYPEGSYVRNPPGSRHSPFSEPGCRIFVKLRQFDDNDLTPVTIDTRNEHAWERGGPAAAARLVLHRFGPERVAMSKVPAGTSSELRAPAGGLECFMIAGAAELDGRRYDGETWFRLPAGDGIAFAAIDDCLLWQKTGHLPA